MHITNDKMRRPLKTIIFGLGLAASLLAQIAVAQPALLVDTGAGSGVPGIPLFGTGSTTCSPQPGCASNFQYLAGQFTLANGATLDSVQGWMSVAGAMSMVVRIYADNSGVPGTSIFSKTYTLDFSPTAWVIFAGFNPVLAAGTYWLAFEPANGSNFQAAMPTDAPNPLPNYAFYVNGNIRYINFGLFGPQPGFGVRVSGTTSTTSPTFPSGTFTQVTQFTNCCNPVVVVDNVDVISGDVGRPKTVASGGSQLGFQFAEAAYTTIVLNGTTVTTNGPTVGASSLSNQGVGSARAVSFATFNNNLTVAQTLRVNADLVGLFQNAPFGLPNGTLRAGAAIHVFDFGNFNAALNTSGISAGQFLLGGYTPLAALDPNTAFQTITAILGNAILTDKSVKFSNVPECVLGSFAGCLPIPLFDDAFLMTLDTDFFTVEPGKSIHHEGMSRSLLNLRTE